MKYVGVVKTFHSSTLDEDVSILKYVKDSEGNVPYCLCSRCNRPIKNILYVVQSDSTDIEMLYLGADCVKHLD